MQTHPPDTSQERVEALDCLLDRILTTVRRTVYPELDLDNIIVNTTISLYYSISSHRFRWGDVRQE